MDFEILRGVHSTPYAVLVYGIAGIGKSWLAAQAQNVIFADAENGTAQLDCARVRITTFKQLGEFIKWVTEQPFDTVVLDSTTAIEAMMTTAILKEKEWESLEDPGYGKGFEVLKQYWAKLLKSVDYLKRSNKNVILIGHARVKSFADPMSAAYDRYELDVQAKAMPMLVAGLDAVFFMRWHTRVTEDKEKRISARSNGDRELFTRERPAFIAKSRFSQLGEVIANPDAALWQTIKGETP